MALTYKMENGLTYFRRLQNEFHLSLDPRAQAVLLHLSGFVWGQWQKDVIITCLVRTALENRRVGGSSTSAHVPRIEGGTLYPCRAWDIRSRIYTDEQIQAIQDFLERTWGTDFIYVLYHDSGSGKHIHGNVRYKYRRSNIVTV